MATQAPRQQRPKQAAPSKRGRASAELREAVKGRDHEFRGIAFIAVGVLLGLGIYLDLAGPFGRGVETVVGWFAGVGRFLVPLVMVGIGVALVRKGQAANRIRLVVGCSVRELAAERPDDECGEHGDRLVQPR